MLKMKIEDSDYEDLNDKENEAYSNTNKYISTTYSSMTDVDSEVGNGENGHVTLAD